MSASINTPSTIVTINGLTAVILNECNVSFKIGKFVREAKNPVIMSGNLLVKMPRKE